MFHLQSAWRLSKHWSCCLVLVFLGACGGGSPPAVVVVQPPVLPPSVNVTPQTAQLPVGTIQQFFAAVTRAPSKVVTWTASAGSVDVSGRYVAPMDVPEGAVATVTATLVSNPDIKSSAMVTISTQPLALTVAPATATVKAGLAFNYLATVTGTSNQAVTWSVNDPEGATYPGSISGGVYRAPSPLFSPHSYVITATSVADPSKSAAAEVVTVPLENQEAQTFPIKLGASGLNSNTSDCCSGTLGSLLTDQKGKQYILSNNHVAGRMGAAKPGEAIIHPGFIDANCDHVTPQTVAKFSKSGAATSNVDAAISEVVPGAVDPKGEIIGLGGVNPDGSYIAAPPSATVASAVVGMRVAKSGRTTGVTCGTVQALNGTVQLSIPAECGIPVGASLLYRGQVILDSLVRAGDSGSLIVEAATARPVALVSGSNGQFTSANPVGDILTVMNGLTGAKLSFVGGGDHAVSCSSAFGSALRQSATSLSALPLRRTDISRAMAVQARHEEDLLKLPGVLGVAIGREQPASSKPALLVFVDRDKRIPALPATLEGLTLKVIATGTFLPAVADSRATGSCQK